ncbi:hypothetical protein CAPTEDRAFT_196440 [Capitella teleta]|uniref:protein-tyrosine-phosphatase n=1 Tax=Capitella teleta TaxID=283909 RepID=R7VCI1_CAPTE|nr:hypothetical protein CAPTEDRAFT_196440 [Capitella teleta]|eukprot:ELU16548.1 hypothetical protein CAPTEDRAFT_196440 [Capitella teleta]
MAFDDPITRVNGEVQDVEPVVQALVGSAPEAEVEQHGGHSVPLAVDQLEGYVLKKKSIPDGFKAEYQAIDATRVVLESDDASHSDYINANYISGYKDVEKHYIATQGPKASTVVDFWRLLWQEKVNRIVMVTQILEMGKKKCELYWPCDVGTTEEFDTFAVTTVLKEEYADYAYLKFRVTHQDEKVLLTLMELVTRWQQQSGVAPVTVHCTNGVERSALFAIASYLMDMLKAEQVVDVYLASCFITSKCPLALPLLEQYQFLFELAGSFMSNFETYANFK